MKILIVGSSSENAIELLYAKYLSELNHEVRLFAAHSIFQDYYFKNLFNKITLRINDTWLLNKIQSLLLDEVADYSPDLIWVFKGLEIYPKTIKLLKLTKAKLVNYNPDHPFIYLSKGSGNQNIRNSINLYDLHFSYSLQICSQLEKQHNILARWLPFGYELDDTVFNEDIFSASEINRACFVGNPDKHRVSFLNELIKKKIPIDIYGHNWARSFTNASKNGVNVFGPVYGLDMYKTLRLYRIQLNLFRPHNEGSHNMRTFEIPAVGGVGLYPDTSEHHSFFNKDTEVFMYDTVENCVKTIEQVLLLPIDTVNIIRSNSRNRSVNSKYSYKDRAELASKTFQELF